MLKTGFIGAGFASAFHYESVIDGASGLAEPIGVFSPRPESRARFAQERNLRAFDTLDSLLDAVDVAHVCVPAVYHEEVTVAALKRNVHVILEKPFTGYFGPSGTADFRGNVFPKETMRNEALASAARIVEAERSSAARVYYAENWVFSPVIRKEVEIIRKTSAQILWMIAEEAHSGSHSPTYGVWRSAGGGSIMGKGTHPLTAVLYLKRIEGMTRTGKPIRPVSVTARTHEITRLPAYEDKGFLRTNYTDVEDFALVHLVFEDGMVADVFSSEIVMGGVHNWLEVFANNHRTRCNINPVNALETYNPVESQFDDIYVVEKIGTKQGWTKPAPDENWMNGYVQELRSFYTLIDEGKPSESSAELGYDTVNVIYSSYLSAERRGTEVTL
ncbi:MAG TPA: Gfo/Idh/MocA family oxidoreductase [Spirochaetia bacterium]|nr:Gfo/Idh/MocA family oxidoreductase [Spirochaetia bacterium]